MIKNTLVPNWSVSKAMAYSDKRNHEQTCLFLQIMIYEWLCVKTIVWDQQSICLRDPPNLNLALQLQRSFASHTHNKWRASDFEYLIRNHISKFPNDMKIMNA